MVLDTLKCSYKVQPDLTTSCLYCFLYISETISVLLGQKCFLMSEVFVPSISNNGSLVINRWIGRSSNIVVLAIFVVSLFCQKFGFSF